jgi:cytochrome c biogenesis protein CcdA
MDPTLALAFTAGMLAVINPCALGMIPAYIALGGSARPSVTVILRGVSGLALGFVGLFSLMAVLVAFFGHALLTVTPIIGAAIGLLLAGLGVAMLLGRNVHLALPSSAIRGGPERFVSQVLFGATYGLASLGCALPIFLAFSATALNTRDPLALLVTVGVFATGTATTLVGVVLLASGSAVASQRLLTGALMRYGGGLLLVAAGLYLAYLQLGFLIGYPLGIPTLTPPL